MFRITKSERIRWAGHVARIGEKRRCTQNFGGNVQLEDLEEGM
jgi:hypothetical protein